MAKISISLWLIFFPEAKYSKVKKYYFEKDAQVTQLQNTVANQRMSMSRTSLDDAEYTTRFTRLDGAIGNLSFNIRKNWKGIPPWLGPYVNRDAHTVGTKEMTTVGRACITRWIVDEIWDRYFHPCLEVGLSSQLKIIEKNIRRENQSSATAGPSADEHREDLTTKLTNWRLVTVEGLHEFLFGGDAAQFRANLTHGLIERLIASLQMNLTDPPPPGLDAGVAMIIELAIQILYHLPLESRDVCIDYFMPGTPINDALMTLKIEPGIPPLTHPALVVDFTGPPPGTASGEHGDHESTTSGVSGGEAEQRDQSALENEIRDSAAKTTAPPTRADSMSNPTGAGSAAAQQQSQSAKDKAKKQSFLGGLVNKKPPPPPDGGPGPRGSAGPAKPEDRERDERERKEREEREREGTIRFATFVAVEVKGRAVVGGPEGEGQQGLGRGNRVLVRAPVYGY
jgi:hypothetical protein